MAYKRKTKDCYAKVQLKTYKENVNYPVRIKKWRERKEREEN